MRRADDYSRADRLLHRIALSSPGVLETVFDVERAIFGRRARRIVIDRPVFVTGLARAGTSLVTRLLYDSGAFAAPIYRDMPFPLAPNLWSGIARARAVESRERGHGDGLSHDLDSPEAIEEVFWRALEGSRYIRADALVPAPPTAETLSALADYIRLVLLRAGKARYLSKNNNNVLRLAALRRALPGARFVHPFRAPRQQVGSLMRQHARALTSHAADPFRRRYMTWLVHHEFGADLRPMRLNDDCRVFDASRPDDWLRLWIEAYRSVLDSSDSNRFLLDYDALARSPARHAGALARFVGIGPAAIDASAIIAPAGHDVGIADGPLAAEADALHAQLCERARMDGLAAY